MATDTITPPKGFELELGFERRMNQPTAPFIQTPEGTISTHKMAWGSDEKGFYAFPTIVERGGKLQELSSEEADRYAHETGELKRFGTQAEAEAYAAGSWKKVKPPEGFVLEGPEVREDFFDELLISDKPISEWLPTEQAEAAKRILDTFDDPENTEDRISSALLLSDMFDIDLPTVFSIQPEMMKEIFGDELVNISERFKKEPIEGGFFKKVAESWRRGDRRVLADIGVYEAAFEGYGNEEEALAVLSKIQLDETLHPIEGSFLADLVYSGAEVVPGMARGYWSAIPQAFTGMSAGALMALAAGQIPPLTLAPEEIVTVPVGATLGLKIGLMTGAATFWYKQGAGSMYAAMIEKGYDPEISKYVAGVGAIPYAIVEFLQVSRLTPGLRQATLQTAKKSMLRVIGDAATRYGTTWTVEVFEEVVQEAIQIATEDTAGLLSDELKIPHVGEFLSDRAQRVWQTTKEAGKAMALLPIPSAAIDIRTGAKSTISTEKKAEIIAKLPPQAPEERPAVPPVAEVPAEGIITPPKPTEAEPKGKGEQWAIRLKTGEIKKAPFDKFVNHADMAIQLGIAPEDIESAGFIVSEGKYATQTREVDKQERVDLIKGKMEALERKPAVEELRQRDLLGREMLRGGVAGEQAAFLEKEKYRLAEPDIEGQMVMPHEVTEEAVPVTEAPVGLEKEYLEKTGRTISQTQKLIKDIEKKIVESDVYQAEIEAQEVRAREIDVGVYYVEKTFKGEVKAAIESHPSLRFRITHDPTKGTPWDTAVQEGLLLRTAGVAGEMDISEFLERVAEALETRKKTGLLNEAALEGAQEKGDPDLQIMADIRYGLIQGKAAAEINTEIREWSKFYEEQGLSEEDISDLLIKELTDEQRREAIEAAKAKDEKAEKLEAKRLGEKDKRTKAEQERLKEIFAEQKQKQLIRTEAQKQKSKLRQKIHAVAAIKGLTKKALSDLKLKHAGYRTLAGKVAVKKITTEQLEALLKAVQKARPTRVDGKKVLTKKQENKIASLKESLISLKHLTEADYANVLRREARGKEAKYIDSKNFITQTEAANVIRRIHNQAEITRVVEARESAIRDNPEIAQQVASIDKTINDKRAEMKRDPWQFESMRYYNEQMELKTGAPFYALYLDLTDTHLESTKTRTARLQQLANEVAGFKELSRDEEALQRISLYISSQSRLKTPVPKNITAEEITMAKAIQKIFKEYEAKARWTRFYWWYISGQQTGAYPIGDYEQYKKEIGKAVDIYESKGKDAVIEYLKTQEWGVIKSGYEPLENIVQKVRLYKLKPTTVGKSHIEVRTAVEYHNQDRNVLRRLGAYMRQMDMLNDLSPKINAYIQLFEDNQSKFNNPARVKESVENYIQTLKRYNIEGGFWARITARLYAQAMRTIIMPSPVLSFRNLFQNAAFEHDKSILIDPRNEPLTGKDIEYLETFVQQQRAMIEEYFMMGEKPLPGLKAISQLVEYVKLYPVSDLTNRRWSFWGKINQVRRALKADTTTEIMTEARFADMSDFEQRMALAILAKDGKDAMARFVSRVHVADIHFLYERAQRAPVEMGGGLARIYGNLMLFPRAYGEKLTRVANKMLRGANYEEQWRGLKTLIAVIGGGLVAGVFYKRITGRKRNPYNPLVILSWRPGGLAQGAIDAVGEAYSSMIMAASGDKRALAAFLNALPGMANMFIPFYDISLRGIEAVTDQKNIDYKLVRQMRAAIDNEYKIRGGAYKMKRDALEKWQYFIGGAGVDQKEKRGKSVPQIVAE